MPIDAVLLGRAARAAGKLNGPVEIVVVDDAGIREVNRTVLGHDFATDVVTCPMEEPHLWGEIVVSAETAAREARRRRVPFSREIALYVVHGVLHLAGLDDRTQAGRRAMRAAESAALARLFRAKLSGALRKKSPK